MQKIFSHPGLYLIQLSSCIVLKMKSNTPDPAVETSSKSSHSTNALFYIKIFNNVTKTKTTVCKWVTDRLTACTEDWIQKETGVKWYFDSFNGLSKVTYRRFFEILLSSTSSGHFSNHHHFIKFIIFQ